MGPELLTVVLSLLAGSLFASQTIRKLVEVATLVLGGEKPTPQPSYSGRLRTLTESLMKSSEEMDELINELTQITKDRQAAMEKVETDLITLQSREKELQQRIDQLNKVPLPVAEHFAKLTELGERRSAKRDYVLFVAGVLVSSIIAIGLKVVGLG